MATSKIQNGWQWNIKRLYSLLSQRVGVKAGTNVTVSEVGGGLRTSTFTFTNQSVTMTDQTTNGSQGNLKFYDFPEGLITIVGATTNLTIARVGTNLTTTAAIVGSVGTAAAAITDATLTGTEADIIGSSAATLTAGAGAHKFESTGVAVFDGTTAAKSAYLNYAVVDAGSAGNDALTVNGTVTIVWAYGGDN